MKLGIVLYSTEPEVVWNAFRLAIFSQKQEDKVSIFLLAQGVEAPDLQSEKFNITSLIKEFVEADGQILSCTTCIQSRNKDENALCPLATLQDLYSLIKMCDRVLTF